MSDAGIYQHYKGPFYLSLGVGHHSVKSLIGDSAYLIGVAQHSEMKQLFEVYADRTGLKVYSPDLLPDSDESSNRYMVYVPLYPHEGVALAIRPFGMFHEKVEFGGRTVKRFVFVGHTFPERGEAFLRPRATVEQTIGSLDRGFSEFLIHCKRPDLDDADAQTLKHHADDMIGVALKGLEIIGERTGEIVSANIRTTVTKFGPVDPEELVECIFNGQGDFVALADTDLREASPGNFVRAVPRSQLDLITNGKMRVYSDGSTERIRR